ncbi:hypothetical protein BKA70DRAFT_1232162 [Coprinopsis sp. MPI-PUGE-AT-0042]|nr:hypothetical protein BKA70DRAFT_1232162 [Coprinopsis sp. MPI-PUGE-AT-0042]
MPKYSSHSTTEPMLPGRPRSSRAHAIKEEVDSDRDGAVELREAGLVSVPGIREVGPCEDYKKKAEVLERQLRGMKSVVARLRTKVEAKTEQTLDLKAELQQMRKDMEMMEQESDRKDELLDATRKDAEQYRTWWLNEVQFMKLMLNKIPKPNRDIDFVPQRLLVRNWVNFEMTAPRNIEVVLTWGSVQYIGSTTTAEGPMSTRHSPNVGLERSATENSDQTARPFHAIDTDDKTAATTDRFGQRRGTT